MSNRWRIVALLGVALIVVISGSPPKEHSPRIRTGEAVFAAPEAGRPVAPAFEAFYQEQDGLALLGSPITGPIDDQQHGLLRQFFRNGLLELDLASGEVRLGPLSWQIIERERTPGIVPDQVVAGAEFYPPTSHSVAGVFLQFYLRYGGPGVLGYPIAEQALTGDRIVQYLERSVLVWYPELPGEQQVQLMPVGEQAFYEAGLDPRLLEYTPAVYAVTGIRVSAAVEKPVMGSQDGDQRVYAVVRDQANRPVAGAEVEATIQLPEKRQDLPPVTTEKDGTAVVLIPVGDLPVGKMILVQIQADYESHRHSTACAFRTWW